MRITYRFKDVKEYWKERWDKIPSDQAMDNINVYPLKYSRLIIKDKDSKILEAGCGAGRILRYYHDRNYNIYGIDYIESAIIKLKEQDSTLKISVGDITKLKFPSNYFKYVLAFGLYHNLNNNLDEAILETYRVLEKNGYICASFRADNIQTRIVDFLTYKKEKKLSNKSPQEFHKLNLNKKEFSELFSSKGFEVLSIEPVVNMPLLYKFKFFRHSSQKIFNEAIGRVDGYRLSYLGSIFQKLLMYFFKLQFCNLYILIAKKIN